jgi:septum formation protein
MIILASQSEARSRLLSQAGVEFTVLPPDFDENSLKSNGPDTTTLARDIAKAKSLSISINHPQSLIIGADQTLHCNGTLLSKPGNQHTAWTQLQNLRGKSHILTSAVCVSRNGEVLFQDSDIARLSMRNFSDVYLEHYLAIAGTAILNCVGSYQIEGKGINLFTDIDGDLFTIQGLPLLPLLAFLREVGELPT